MSKSSNKNRYPIKLKEKFLELHNKGFSNNEILTQLDIEFPVYTSRIRKLNNPHTLFYGWKRNSQKNNIVELSNEESNIVDYFALTTKSTSDSFSDIVRTIPKLLKEKKEELVFIQKQIKKLEELNKILAEEKEEEEEISEVS